MPTWPLPRIGSRRHVERPTLGQIQIETARMMGVEMYGWQRWTSDVSLELVPRNKPGTPLRLAAGVVGIVAGRQAGKSLWVASRALLQCLLPELTEAKDLLGLPKPSRRPPTAPPFKLKPQHVGVTAQDRIGALDRWYEHCELIMESPFAERVSRWKKKNGEEEMRFTNGSSYKVLTPSRTGARGQHLDLVIIDEALAHPTWLMSTIRPTTAQRDGAMGCIGAQLLLVSNAGDERSTLLNEQRELGRRAVATDDPRRVWLEWSAPDDADPYDEAVWAATIPTLEQPDGISLEFIRSEAEAQTTDDFAREYLCRYTPRRERFVIDPAVWDALPPFVPGPQVVLAADATRDRDAASVVAAGVAEDCIAIEIVRQAPGVDWVAAYLIDVAQRQNATVAIDAFGPLAAVIGPLERAGVDVMGLKVGDVVVAAQTFIDLVTTGRLAHVPDPRFEIASLGKRKVGERFAFARQGDVDISPIVAASLAAWAVDNDLAGVPSVH